MNCDLRHGWADRLEEWSRGPFESLLILWQSYELALEMHESM